MSYYVRDTRSKATKAQQKHWETLGQLHRLRGLINYMRSQKTYLDPYVAHKLSIAHSQISQAIHTESRNNEFINLNITPKWRNK